MKTGNSPGTRPYWGNTQCRPGPVFLGPNDFNLPETGIRFIPCLHDACAQSSIEETELIRQLIPWLENQSCRTKTGDIQPVTLSRARSLAILIANPRLLETACNTVEQMGLINTCAGDIMPGGWLIKKRNGNLQTWCS